MDTISILLVEDIKIAQIVASLIIKSLNCHLDVAENGKDALSLVNQNHYDCILMDIGLPDLDGFTVAQMIRQGQHTNKDTLIVALTAHDRENFQNKLLDSGMNYFLTKPLTVDSVKEVMKKFNISINN